MNDRDSSDVYLVTGEVCFLVGELVGLMTIELRQIEKRRREVVTKALRTVHEVRAGILNVFNITSLDI